MTYVYDCASCARQQDVVKLVEHFDREEHCSQCQAVMKRAIPRGRIYLSGTKVQERIWQPAMGRGATTNELRAEARKQGWEEVGNERPERHLAPQLAEYPSFTNDEIGQLLRKES